MTINQVSCDIFCKVVDNFGDIGVCWRLARQLANEQAIAVRLWVDDLPSFSRLCQEVEVTAEQQQCRGVEVRYWGQSFPKVQPAKLVIEAFACKLPEPYVVAMAAQSPEPVWINLEYLSAEDWVEGCHKLPSPHMFLPLTKYFFFPGFTDKTGSLLLEHDLLVQRDAFQNDVEKQKTFWRSIGMEMPPIETLNVSLFGYENDALPGLLDAWVFGAHSVICLVPEGRILPQLGEYFAEASPNACKTFTRGNLQVRVLPFIEQEQYDKLLWACDVNFVRGEDSFVRAQWAGKLFVWQIYPQHDAVHLKKLDAFLGIYTDELNGSAKLAVIQFFNAWNMGSDAGEAWQAFMTARGEVEDHAKNWARQHAGNNLALNLLDFSREIGRMRALEIEGR